MCREMILNFNLSTVDDWHTLSMAKVQVRLSFYFSVFQVLVFHAASFLMIRLRRVCDSSPPIDPATVDQIPNGEGRLASRAQS